MGPYHRGLQRLVQDLNGLYRTQPALYQVDFSSEGFQWMDCDDSDASVVSFVRRARDPQDFLLFVCNFTPVVRGGYRVGVPRGGFYHERLNTDGAIYGGSNVGNAGNVLAEPIPTHGQPYSLRLDLPPLATLVLRPDGVW
jgi:1,4-alpha-glucan branching enzyme